MMKANNSWFVVCCGAVSILLLGTLLAVTGCQRLGGSSAPADVPPVVVPSDPALTPGDVVAPQPTQPPANLVVDDPLTGGVTVGTVNGRGEFTAEGYKVTSSWRSYIFYSTDIYQNIRVEFDARGYVPREDDGDTGKIVVFEITDAPDEYSWHGLNYCGGSSYGLVHLRKRGLYEGQSHHKVDGLQLVIAGKACDERVTWHGHSPMGHPISWDPNVTYHWVIEIVDHVTTITRDGQELFSLRSTEFDPDNAINVRIGGVGYGGRSCPQGVTYSNVQIFRL